MAVIPYPDIDSGYIYDPGKKFDRLMSDFFEAEYSQSYLFYGSIASLPWLVQTYQSDETVLAQKIRSTLMTYLEKYFDSVEVECAPATNGTAVSYDIRLYAVVTQGDSVLNLEQIIRVTGTKFELSRAIRT